MSEYLPEIKSLCDQLDSIGSPISENEKIYGVLNGLGKEYESITTVIENSMDLSPGISLEDVSFKLIGFDDKLQTYDLSTTVTPHQAFYVNRGGYRGGFRGGFRGGRGSGRGNYRGRGSYSTQGRGFHQQLSSGSQSSQSQPAPNQRPTCQICGKYGHSAYKCYNRFDQDYQPADNAELHNAFSAIKLSDQEISSGHEWYPDSGATAHITNSTSQLQTSQPYHGDETVIIGNGDFLPITHIGSAALPSTQGQNDKSNAHSGK